MLSKTELVKALIKGLKLDDNIFNYEVVNEELDAVPENSYMDFYKEVMSFESYGNGLNAIIKISEKYQAKKTDNLLAGTRDQAKDMYDKFYCESRAMLDFVYNNREKYPTDRDFFNAVDYSKLTRKDGSEAYTKQELYVLNELGGGEFLIGIRLALSSTEVIDKIEAVIKKAVMTKYDNHAISHNAKLIGSAVDKTRTEA